MISIKANLEYIFDLTWNLENSHQYWQQVTPISTCPDLANHKPSKIITLKNMASFGQGEWRRKCLDIKENSRKHWRRRHISYRISKSGEWYIGVWCCKPVCGLCVQNDPQNILFQLLCNRINPFNQSMECSWSLKM